MKDITIEELDEMLTAACRDRDAYAEDLRAARAEVERLRAELAEALATLANERGEGEPPAEGWVWTEVGWVSERAGLRVARHEGSRRWEVYPLRPPWGRRGYADTARAAIRAAAKAVRGEP